MRVKPDHCLTPTGYSRRLLKDTSVVASGAGVILDEPNYRAAYSQNFNQNHNLRELQRVACIRAWQAAYLRWAEREESRGKSRDRSRET
jgi:hypothetical protein